MKIFARPVNIGTVDEEYFEIVVDKTQSLREVYQFFQAYLRDEKNCSEDEYDYEIERIAIIQESRPYTKLAVNELIKDIVREANSDRFTFVFPRNGQPIIQIHDGEKYYYIDNYGRNDLLLYIVQKEKEIMAIIQKGQYEQIKINGEKVIFQTAKNKPFKDFLENRINTLVTISIKLKEASKKLEDEKVEEIKVEKAKKQQIQEEGKEEKPKNVQQKKEESKVQQEKEKKEQKLEQKKEDNQEVKIEEKGKKVQQNLPIQQPQVPANIPQSIKLLKLVIKFQSNSSNKKQDFSHMVDPSRSMLQLLPQIIINLKSRGFHWQSADFDKSRGDLDKLSIIYSGYQFKKLERPLRNLVNFPHDSTMIFTFERHYEGGA